jgi:hypothetical protein
MTERAPEAPVALHPRDHRRDLRTAKHAGRASPAPRAERRCLHRRPGRTASTGLAAPGASVTSRFDDTNPERRTSSCGLHLKRTSVGSASIGREAFYASTISTAYDFAVTPDRGSRKPTSILSAEGDPRPVAFTEPGRTARTATARRRGPGLLRACGRASSPRAHVLRAPDRHGIAELEPPRPHALSHPADGPSPDRRPLVHLPALRLHALPLRLARGHHALDLHARVREPPAALRLGARRARHALSPAADRVRAPEPELHGDEQAQAPGARDGRPRTRVGRPADADHLGLPPARLHARGDSRLLREASESPSATARSTSPCSSTASART